MRTYDESWDQSHAPGPQELWQESDWLTFYDPGVGVGATYRIGQEPNRRKGQPSLFAFALGGERFLLRGAGERGLDVDISPEDRWTSGYRVDGHEVNFSATEEFALDGAIWTRRQI
jgi:hypothetical protein